MLLSVRPECMLGKHHKLAYAWSAQGANNKRMAAIYRTQFKRLMRWCLLMGMFCFAVLIFLITARGNITSIRGYIQVHTKSFSTLICRCL